MWLFFLLSAIGLLVSAAVHFSTYAGIDPQEMFPYVWLLHIGIFVVFIPAIAVQNTILRNRANRGTRSELLAHAPRWMRLLCGALGTYAVINFVAFIFLMSSGSPSRQDNGTYALRNHGTVIRTITEQEYHRYRAYEVRGFSGHWMIFYCLAMTMIASGMGAPRPQPASPVNLARPFLPWGLPVWAHATLQILAQILGFFGGAIAMFAVTFRLWRIGMWWCGLFPLTFITAVACSISAAALVQKFVPARCPACGGRLSFARASSNRISVCTTCGYTSSAPAP